MKLRLLHLDDMVTVPGGRLLGEAVFGDACESTFNAADGWELYETSTQGVFTIRAAHMTEALTVGGYGYTYVAAVPAAVLSPIDQSLKDIGDAMASAFATAEPVLPTKGKRR